MKHKSGWLVILLLLAGWLAAAESECVHKKIYVILFCGQSNAAGWGYRQYLLDSRNPLAEPQTDVEMFTGTGLSSLVNTLTNLQSGAGIMGVKVAGKMQYPMLTVPPINRFGPELSLGRTVRDLIRIPNSKVVVIKYAASNTSLYEDWKPDGTADHIDDGPSYQAFQDTVQRGLVAIREKYPDHEVEIIGVGWVQGESDSLEGQSASYQTNLVKFVADIRATYGSNTIFALSKLSLNQNAGFNSIRSAQDTVAATVPRVFATETYSSNYPVAAGFTEGKLHFLSSALLQIGQDLGAAIMIDNSGCQ